MNSKHNNSNSISDFVVKNRFLIHLANKNIYFRKGTILKIQGFCSPPPPKQKGEELCLPTQKGVGAKLIPQPPGEKGGIQPPHLWIGWFMEEEGEGLEGGFINLRIILHWQV